MALYKLSKAKTFQVDYCGCIPATFLLNDQIIRNTIEFIRQTKNKRDFVKTTVTITRDGIKITYNNEQKISTYVPANMIAGSTMGKSSLQNTVGVVYISPMTGQHYPAFVHVYRCETAHTAQKFLSRLRSYLLIESHRLRIVQLEQQLLERNLLNIDVFNARKSQQNSRDVSQTSPPVNSNQQQPKNQFDPIKSITQELQKKIDSNQPILFPPKDYDTLHAAHGNLQRAQAWKSTEPAIVGYSPANADESRIRRLPQMTAFGATDERKSIEKKENHNDRLAVPPTRRADSIVDPVETVSLAFDFLKDETGSIFTEHDGNIEHLAAEQQNKPAVFRFRPPQMSVITKKLFSRNNNNSNYESANDLSQSNSSSRNNLDNHYNNQYNQHRPHYQQHQKQQQQQQQQQQYHLQNGQRARSETRLYDDPQSLMHLSPRYGSRLAPGSGAPITTNPLWTDSTPIMVGSQPNLLSYNRVVESAPLYRQLSPQMGRRIPSIQVQNALYGSYPDTKPEMKGRQSDHQPKHSSAAQYQSNRQLNAQSQYLDTNEFILRASNGQPLRNTQYPNRNVTRDYRPHSMDVNAALLDVYY